MTKTQCALIAASVLLVSSQPALPQAPDESAPPAGESSEIAPLATKSLLLDAGFAGKRMVVVGERGHVLLSDDQGATWRQAKVPTRALLTAVYFHDDRLGWVVGHDEIILRSEDGGETWTRTHAAPDKEQPLLDVWFKDASTGFAFGAYGTILASTDGGRSELDGGQLGNAECLGLPDEKEKDVDGGHQNHPHPNPEPHIPPELRRAHYVVTSVTRALPEPLDRMPLTTPVYPFKAKGTLPLAPIATVKAVVVAVAANAT